MTKKIGLSLAVSLLAILCANSAWAYHRHAHVGVYVGPYWGPRYYAPYPYYSAPYYSPTYYPPVAPVIVTPPAPPVYIQQSYEPTPAPAASPVTQEHYWYYCTESKSYYPYVKECRKGWQRVSPQPQSPQ